MADAREILMSVVGAVADGDPVDWNVAESTPMNDDERSLLAQLKVLEGLHRVHRTGSPGSSSPGRHFELHTVDVDHDRRHDPGGTADTNLLTAEAVPKHWGPLEIRGV